MRRLLAGALTLAALTFGTAAQAMPNSPGMAASPRALAGGPFATRAVASLETLAVPPNDAIVDATPIEGLPYMTSESTVDATLAFDDPFCSRDAAATVWYAWEAPGSASITADTFGSDYDTMLSVYTGSPGLLTQVACNDDAGGGTQSELTFQAEAGRIYYLMAAGASGGGTLTIRLQAVTPLPQVTVRATRADEVTPSAGINGIAWAQRAATSSGFWSLFALVPVDGKVKVNAPGTSGFSGGFRDNEIVYQQVDGNRSDIRFFNLFNHQRRNPPSGINTRFWEWHPTVSGDWLLFGRRNFRTRVDTIVLRNLVSGRSLVLDRLPRARANGGRFAEAGQVNGNYAVWFRCASGCDVFRYDITNGTKVKIPNPGDHWQHGPSVAEDGTVYLIRSGLRCGAAVRLVRYPLGGPATVITALPSGRDSYHTYADDDRGDTSASVYFERYRCSSGRWDVLKVVDP
jgi:hypothetical protein